MPTDRFETAARCLERLGPPPADIAQRWLDDARSQVSTFSSAQFDPVDPVWQTVQIDENGRLTQVPTRLRLLPAGVRKPRRSMKKQALIGGIAVLLVVGITAAWIRTSDSANPDSAKPNSANPDSTKPSATKPGATQPSAEPFASTSVPSKSDPFAPGFIDDPGLVDDTTGRQDSTRAGSAISTANVDQSLAQDSPLETMAGEAEPANDNIPVDTEDFAGNFSLGSLMPVLDELPAAQQSDIPASAPETVAGIDITEPDSDEEMVGSAIARQTIAATPVQSQTTAVAIPRPPATASSDIAPPVIVLRAQDAPARLQLEFPEATPLSLRIAQDPQTWQVFSAGATAPIAEMQWNPNQTGDGTTGLEFRWLSGAALAGDAETLSHGRLVSEDGHIAYLRAQLDADPVALDFTDKDEELKWDLGAPITNALVKLAVAIEVPDDVQLQWIEPVDAASPRRTRGIAMLMLRDSPDASALVVRIDIRATSVLSMRVRVGGRLDPKLPWQWTDAQTVRRSLDAVTTELQFADEKLLRLDAAISQAKKQRARRREAALEIQRDQIDEAVKTATAMAKRLAELDQLVALLAAEGRVTANLSVPWPTGEHQTLLGLRAVQ